MLSQGVQIAQKKQYYLEMHLSKHTQHRNSKYLDWLRKQKCVVSGDPAQCAHHIRLGTNGGTSLKPSDYFCIPLLNEYHTTGPFALHVVGEETFLNQFKLEPKKLFVSYLKEFLMQEQGFEFKSGKLDDEKAIAKLIELLESNRTELPKKKKSTKKKADSPKEKAPSITEDGYYQKAKELKRERDKELRKKLKDKTPTTSTQSLKGNEVYEKAKELKRKRDKELRKKLKAQAPKAPPSFKGSDQYEIAKEKKRELDKEFRKKNKEKLSKLRKKKYRELKAKLNK